MAVKETSTTYTWPDGGVIKRIDARTQKNGFAVAYLYADDREEERTARTNIRAAIRLKGWGTLSDSRDDKFVLRVAGLRSGDELVGMLRKEGYITSDPQVHTSSVKQEESKGVVSSVKSHTLRASGILATLGNALSIASGFHRRSNPSLTAVQRAEKTNQIKMGAAFALADLPLMFVDESDNSRQLNLLLKKLTKEYERNGIEIPKNASIYIETSNKNKTFGERTQDFFHAYANQIKCSFEVLAAVFSVKAGFEQRPAGDKSFPRKAIAGIIFGPGFLASLLIPEKKIDEEKYAQAGSLKRIWMKIQSNPLSVGGMLGYSNTVMTYASARKEQLGELALKQQGLRSNNYYRWDYTIPTIMIGANGLYAVSKKTVGGDIKNDAMVQDAYRIASQIINKQPGELREKAMEITAKFFGQRMEIKEHYPEARARLIQELDSQRQNPWFELQGLPPYVAVPKHPHHRNTVETDIALSQQPASAIAQPTNHVDTQTIEHSAPVRAAELSA